MGTPWVTRNKERHNANARAWYHKNRGKARESRLKYNYGISWDEWYKMLFAQDARCAICRQEKKLFVDHDHKTNKVRGLLCLRCNSSLGELEANLDRVQDYLDGARGKVLAT